MTEVKRADDERGRRELLGLAAFYGVDLVALSTSQPNGSATLDWDVLEDAVKAAARPFTQQATDE